MFIIVATFQKTVEFLFKILFFPAVSARFPVQFHFLIYYYIYLRNV